MLACIEVLFIALELLIDMSIKVIEVVSNIIEYFIEIHKDKKSNAVINISKAENIESEITEDITITEVKREYIKPNIDILN